MLIKEIDLNTLYNTLVNNIVIGKGNYGTILTLDQDNLIKVSNKLYSSVKPSFGEYYIDIEESKYYNFFTKINIDQLEYYSSIQNDVKLTKFPKGIVVCNNIPCGVILPYHKEHDNLINLSHVSVYETRKYNIDYYELMKIKLKSLIIALDNLLKEIKELEEHKVSQNDLTFNYSFSKEFNILVQSSIPQIIDFDSYLVEYGNDFKNARYMYGEFLIVLDILKDIIDVDLNFKTEPGIQSNYYLYCNEILKEYSGKILDKKLFK